MLDEFETGRLSNEDFFNPVDQTSNLTVTLSGASYGYFYSNSTCTTAITSLTIAASSNSQTFYFKDLIGENVTISAASATHLRGIKDSMKHNEEKQPQPPTPLQRARQILATAPAALVTIQADGTLMIVTSAGRIEVSGELIYRID
jgi:hypothetical protein